MGVWWVMDRWGRQGGRWVDRWMDGQWVGGWRVWVGGRMEGCWLASHPPCSLVHLQMGVRGGWGCGWGSLANPGGPEGASRVPPLPRAPRVWPREEAEPLLRGLQEAKRSPEGGCSQVRRWPCSGLGSGDLEEAASCWWGGAP